MTNFVYQYTKPSGCVKSGRFFCDIAPNDHGFADEFYKKSVLDSFQMTHKFFHAILKKMYFKEENLYDLSGSSGPGP